jgi:anti-anti-sigma factor
VLGGALRLQNSNWVREQIAGLMDLEPQTLYLHLGRLLEVDSSGLGLLVGLHMTARKRKIEFILLAPTDQQIKLFEATRLNAVFNLQTGTPAANAWERLVRDEFAFTPPAPPV